MSNDWSVIPACAVEFNGDTALETEPHCVVWSFHDKAEAQRFAVKAEYINEHNLDLAAASIFLDSIKALGPDTQTRVALAAIGEGVKTQLKLNNAMALLERACNGNLDLVAKMRELVEKVG